MKEYIPNPVDTGHIQLPKELEYLVEEMAKNVHEVWLKTRIEQGWTYGEKRDDVLKQHPCLVPYEELPEEEKEEYFQFYLDAFKHGLERNGITEDHANEIINNTMILFQQINRQKKKRK